MEAASVSASSVFFSGKPVVRAHGDKVDIETLVPMTKISVESLAAKILKIYAPAFLARQVGGEVVLGARRTFADAGDVLSDFCWKIVDVMRVPGIVVIDLARHCASDRDARRH